jgi:hypothetical protein
VKVFVGFLQGQIPPGDDCDRYAESLRAFILWHWPQATVDVTWEPGSGPNPPELRPWVQPDDYRQELADLEAEHFCYWLNAVHHVSLRDLGRTLRLGLCRPGMGQEVA